MFRCTLTSMKIQPFASFVIIISFVFVLLSSNAVAYAYTLGASHSVMMTPTYGYMLYDDGYGGTYCYNASYEGFSPFQATTLWGSLYSDSGCTIQVMSSSDLLYKPVLCPGGEVMVGAGYYQGGYLFDDEHVDATCATVSPSFTLGASTWVSAWNAMTTLGGGYKVATCGSGQVMTGLRTYGGYNLVDDEHVDAYCTQVTGGWTPGGTYSWVSAPNAFTGGNNFYKSANCPTGQILVGVRWYEWTHHVDDEHVDAYCYAQPAAPTVSVSFTDAPMATPSCTAPWGAVVPDGQSILAYLSAAPVLNCTSQMRACTGGTLSGTYAQESCTPTGGGGRGGCFIAGTQVLLADGTYKNIESVTTKDTLMTSAGPEPVMKMYHIPYKGAVYAFNGSGNYFVTPTHPFMTTEGWKSFDPVGTRRESPGIKVSELAVGDTLIMKDGKTMKLESFDKLYREMTVYNFGVNGTHDFYADDYLVHNVDMKFIERAYAAAQQVK